MFERILACVDAEPPGRHAAVVAVDIAKRFKAALTLLTVLPGDSASHPSDLERLVPKGSEGRSIHHQLEEVRAAALAQGVPTVDLLFLFGNPADSIIRQLEKSPPDLVVVGTRGLSRGSRLLLGSLSGRLVVEAPCPVLVVRHVRGRSKALPRPSS